ncbi:MAG TPA: AMIN domain-containing protein [Gemmatimonadaceae bacterium]|jgi:type IV pilus assembly protein PilQ|nr:AMIN domain-containing protein [Gemmatimonadaceae bacterium]
MSFLKALPAAALLFLPATAATVHSVSVVPSSGKTDVVIGINAAVEVQNFTLDAPARVVVDLKGATLAMTPRIYDKVSRGGITNIRYSQFRPNVVRVVIDLDGKHAYDVKRNETEVRITFSGGKTEDYSSWSSSRDGYVAAPAPPQTRHVSATAEAKKTPATVAATSPLQTAAPKAVSQVESQQTQPEAQPAQPEPQYDLPAAVRAPAKPARDVPVALFSQALQSQQPLINVTFQDTDIRDVIASFAAFSGRTIVVGKDVSGTVTAEIRNQPWDVALRAILQGQGLAASEDALSGIITVDSYANIINRQASEPLQTQLVSINYARAHLLVPTIQQLLQKDCPQIPSSGNVVSNARPSCIARGMVAADSATNTLIITETASRLADVLQYVRNLDVRTPQVGIKAKIIFVNRTNIEDIGLSYDLGTGSDQFFSQLVKRTDPSTLKPIDTNGDGVPDALGGGTPITGDRVLLGGNALAAIANANARVVNPALQVVFSTALGKFQLTSFLDALQEVRLADLQAEPSIVTLDNRQASIQVGQEIPIRVLDASTANLGGATAAQTPRATVQMKQVGIILTVTPHITNNRQILLLLHAENSDAQLASSDVGFIFGKQSGDTQLLVGDGETAVIGGLTVTQTTQSKSGIPLLVDLPIIGRLFGETRTDDEKRDLLILVTPHIIDDGAPIPGASSNPIPPATR